MEDVDDEDDVDEVVPGIPFEEKKTPDAPMMVVGGGINPPPTP